MSSQAHETALDEAAVAASEALPISWERAPGLLEGELEGCRERYHVAIATARGRIFAVRVVSHAAVPAEKAAEVGAICMDANWTMPTAGFFLSEGYGGSVVSAATIASDRFTGIPDPMMLQNTIRECVLNAELLAPTVQAAIAGRPIAPSSPGEIPDFAWPSGWAPAPDRALIDACDEAARASGWQTVRRLPGQLVVEEDTFVDVHTGSLIVSSYAGEPVRPERRSEVAGLLNSLLDEGAPFGYALDPERGEIATRCVLELRGLESVPAPGMLCDVISRAAAAARVHADRIQRVAQVPSASVNGRPFAAAGSSLRDRLQANQAI
jgi:hypothetical protein